MKWQVKYFKQLVSTNITAQDFPTGSVIVATQQIGGRGRYGRTWVSPPGNLYLSAVVSDFGDNTPLLAFVVGVSVAEALADFSVQLKWPNDVLLDGGKVAGLLLERTPDGRIIIGIGVNVVTAPTTGMLYSTASLSGKLSVADVQNRILSSLSENLSLFQDGGFASIREKWLKFAVGIGQQIRVQLPQQTLTGIFKEFSPQGELVLETPDKTVHYITAGDVFLL